MSTRRHDDEITALLAEIQRYRARYGALPDPTRTGRIEAGIARRQTRVELLRHQLAELSEEISVLDRELVGMRAALVVHLREALVRMQREHTEGWSPTPIVAYRMWALFHDRIEGVRQPWREPRLTARCGQGFDSEDVPHTDGRCGRLGCGVYAAMDPAALMESFAPPVDHGYVAGAVALTGKVVEHETGYRANTAEVIAVVAVHRTGVLASRDRSTIAALFGDPAGTIAASSLTCDWSRHMTIEYLEQTGGHPWTSASSAA